MSYHADGKRGVRSRRRYTWELSAEENRLMQRLRSLRDGMHLVTVRKVRGQVEGLAVLSAQEEAVGGGN